MIYDVTVCFRHSNLEIRLNIQIYSSPHFFIEKGRILSSCPSRFRTSPYCLMVVLLPSWGNNKCRALIKVAHACKSDPIWNVCCSPLELVIALHTMPRILHPMAWGTSVNSPALILHTITHVNCSCYGSKISGSPPNFPKLISQLWGIPQPQLLLLGPQWTYFF